MLLLGDCLEQLKKLPDNSVDSVVTDPPAGIGFMGKDWDHHKGGREQWIAWLASILKECNRVLKPGGHALVWSIPEREVIGKREIGTSKQSWSIQDGGIHDQSKLNENGLRDVYDTAPATDLAKQWDGWGSALKPSREDWWLVRKPLSESTLAKNVVKHGTGALNIDGTRISVSKEDADKTRRTAKDVYDKHAEGTAFKLGGSPNIDNGRWPSHTIFDEDAAQVLDESVKGRMPTPCGNKKPSVAGGGMYGHKTFIADVSSKKLGGDPQTASRFFYVAKASKSERNKGCEETPNNHPTIKSIKLMEYLIKLITPPGGTVLDPFMGSGSTGVAAKNLGMSFIGIEQNQEYFEIAQKRVE